MSIRFTVRPQPKAGESLTSFLSRVASQNNRQLKDILRILGVSNDRLRRRDYYRLDLVPRRCVDLKSLSELTGISDKVLESHSFGPLLNKFYGYGEIQSPNEKLPSVKDIDVQHRRFCPTCLKEHGVYQLLWQVEEIHTCPIHHSELVTECDSCGRPQPYAPKTLAGFMCTWCGHDLSLQRSPACTSQRILKAQMELHDMWTFLYQSNEQFIQKLDDIPLDKSFVVKLLYVATGQADQWDRNNIEGLSSSTVSYYLHYLNDDKRGYPPKISTLINILRIHNIKPQDLPSISVPSSYFRSSLTVVNMKEPGVCSAVWCRFHGNSNGMKRMRRFSKGKHSVGVRQYHKRGHTIYTLASACMGCSMEYGYDPVGNWVTVSPDIEWIDIIRRCLVKGCSYENIRDTYSIGMGTIQRLVGYMVAHKLLPKFLIDKLKPTDLLEEELIRRFQLIHTHTAKEKTTSAWVLFGWTRTHYYYYRYLDVVQKWYLVDGSFQEHLITAKHSVEPSDDEFMNKLVREIEDMQRSHIPITMIEIIRRLDARFLKNKTVKSTPYREYIKKAIEKQRGMLQELTMQDWWHRAREFIDKRQVEGLVVYVKDVFQSIGVHESTVIRHCPELSTWVRKVCENSRQLTLQLKVDDCLARIDVASDDLISEGRVVTIGEILRRAGVPDYIGYYYPTIVEALHDARERIKRSVESSTESLIVV